MKARSERQMALVLALALVLGMAGLWGALRALAPPPVPPGTVTASLTIQTASWTLEYEATTENNTVLTFLLEAGDRLGFEVAYTHWPDLGAAKVDAIHGVPDGQDGRYWQYWVNGEYGAVGSDRYALSDGDAVLWWHTVYPPEG